MGQLQITATDLEATRAQFQLAATMVGMMGNEGARARLAPELMDIYEAFDSQGIKDPSQIDNESIATVVKETQVSLADKGSWHRRWSTPFG